MNCCDTHGICVIVNTLYVESDRFASFTQFPPQEKENWGNMLPELFSV